MSQEKYASQSVNLYLFCTLIHKWNEYEKNSFHLSIFKTEYILSSKTESQFPEF